MTLPVDTFSRIGANPIVPPCCTFIGPRSPGLVVKLFPGMKSDLDIDDPHLVVLEQLRSGTSKRLSSQSNSWRGLP